MVSEGEKPSDWECELNAVLILVLVEDGLGAALLVKGASFTTVVLILVLVEDGLGDLNEGDIFQIPAKGLNPCFSGGWSRSTVSAHYNKNLKDWS